MLTPTAIEEIPGAPPWPPGLPDGHAPGAVLLEPVADCEAGSWLKRAGRTLQALSIYGALGIASFGWALSRLLHFEGVRYEPLWLFSALFIYNVDRLKADPADSINTPLRLKSTSGLRQMNRAVAALSAMGLVAAPLLERDWLMLLLTTAGSVFCINYSVPLLGFRFKDVPLLKTFFAPALVTGAFLIPPLLEQPLRASVACYALASLWTLCVTLFNMVLCDLRDIEGDATTGVRSLPVALGRRGTQAMLAGLLAAATTASLGVFLTCDSTTAMAWALISIFAPAYLGGLLFAARNPMPEAFYEWWVEGILLLPAAACAAAAAVAWIADGRI
jgi:4-hydroxybenzoate polyprenyltransferase